jgi:hypothetical protein
MKTGIFTPQSIDETKKYLELFDDRILAVDKNTTTSLTANICGMKPFVIESLLK